MKVLLFCFLAISGALAQDDAGAAADAAASTDSGSGSILSKVGGVMSNFLPGNLMGKGVGALESVMNVKTDVIKNTLGMVQDGFSMGTGAASQGFDGAQNILTQAMSTAENVKSTVTGGVGNIIGKVANIGNAMTANKVTGLVGMVNSTGQSVVGVADKGVSLGLNLATNLGGKGLGVGKTVAEKINAVATSGLGAMGKVDEAVTAKIVAGANAAANMVSNAGQKFNTFLANAWKLPTKTTTE